MNSQKQQQQPNNGNRNKSQGQGRTNNKDSEIKKNKKKEMDEEEEEENNDDEWFSDSSTSSNEGQEKEPRLIMYAAFTQYDVVKEVGKYVYNIHLTKNEQSDWDIAWYDGAISIKLLQKMWPHQRTNHFPGMYNLARKNCLGRHLMRMLKWFPQDYDFFPQTFMCPTDYKEFKAQITAKRNKTFIVKPEASCQGKGIFLTRNFEDLDPNEHYVVQRYMHKPYLVDGFKFDLRIYVLLYGVNPLRVFIYKDGLARFATVPYESPTPLNLTNLFMHLTNYAINKESEDFVQNTDENADDVGSKRSFTFILRRIAQEFGEEKSQSVFKEIQDIILKTLCIAQPYLQHLYKSSQPDDVENQMCLQILGFDVMLDHNLKPQLLEVNQSPSFSTDSPLDYKIKKNLISDTIKMMNLSINRKLRAKGFKRAEMQKRLFRINQQPTPTAPLDKTNKEQTNNNAEKTIQMTQQQLANQKAKKLIKSPTKDLDKEKAVLKKQQQEEREQLRKKRFLQREKYEKELCGDYELIYPLVTYKDEFMILELQQQQQQQQIKVAESQRTNIEDSKLKTENVQDEQQKAEEEYKFVPEQLREAWKQQQKYLEFMEKAKELWESFTQGNVIQKKKKEQEQKEKEELQKKQQQQRKAQLQVRMKKLQEEKKAKEEQRMKEEQDQFMQSGEYGENYNLEFSDDRQLDGYNKMKTSQTRKNSSRNSTTRDHQIDCNPQLAVNPFYIGFSAHSAKEGQIMPLMMNGHSATNEQQERLVQKNQAFYLPHVILDKQMANYSYQHPKKLIIEEYQRQQKYAQILQYYNKEGQSLPAVPALSSPPNGYDHGYQGKPLLREFTLLDGTGFAQGHTKTVAYQNNQPPQQRIEQQHAPRVGSKKQLQIYTQVPSQKLNELLQIQSNPSFLQKTQQTPLVSMSTNGLDSKPPRQQINEPHINGIKHYSLPQGVDIAKKLALDKKEVPNLPPQLKAQQSLQIQNTFLQQQQQQQQPSTLAVLGIKKVTKMNSEIVADPFNLGVFGEKKQLMTQDQKCIERNMSDNRVPHMQQNKKRVLKIIDRSRELSYQQHITFGGHKSSTASNNGQGINNVSNFVNANELYRLMH